MAETLPPNLFEPLFNRFREATIDRAIQAHQASLDFPTPISAEQVAALMKHAETVGKIRQLNVQFLAWTQGFMHILQQMAELGVEIPADIFVQSEVPAEKFEEVSPIVEILTLQKEKVVSTEVGDTYTEKPKGPSPVVVEPEIVLLPEVEINPLPSEPAPIPQVPVVLPSEQDHMETLLSAFGNVATERGSGQLSVDEVARMLSSNPADTMQVEDIKQRLQLPSFKKKLKEARRNSGIRVVIEETQGVLSGLQINEIPTLQTKVSETETVEKILPIAEETAIVPVVQAIVPVEQKKKSPDEFELELPDTIFQPALKRESYDLTTTPQLNPLYTITKGSIKFDSVAAFSFAAAAISESRKKQIFHSNIALLAEAFAQRQITKRQLSTTIWELIKLDDTEECGLVKEAIMRQENASEIFAALSVQSMLSLGRADIEQCSVKRLRDYVGAMLSRIIDAEKSLYSPDKKLTDKPVRTGLLNECIVELYELFEAIRERCEDASDAVTIYELAKALVSQKNQRVSYPLQRMLKKMAQEEHGVADELIRIYKKQGLMDNVDDEEDNIVIDDDYVDEDNDIIYRAVRKA